MEVFAAIGMAMLAGGMAFVLVVTTNPLGFPDLTRATLDKQAAAVLARKQTASNGGKTNTAKRSDAPLPSIDVLRAEPDGTFVVAGHASPESAIDLVDRDGTVVASGTVDQVGDFVLLPDEPLKTGAHELRLRTQTETGNLLSNEAAVVSIPERESQTVLAAVIPEIAPTAEAPPPPPLVISDGPTPDVAIEAVEVASGQLAVAGAAKQGAVVQLYLDNKPIGRAEGTVDGRFLLETEQELAPGRHQMRADVIDRADGRVIARAAVPVLHQTTQQLAEANAVETGSSVIIRGGDSLWRISRRTYGRGIRYTTIFAANRAQIRNPNRIYIGQIFKLPTDEDAQAPETVRN